MSLLSEIKRRHVLQVAVVYAVVGWGLIEIVATVEEPLGLPNWVDTLVIVLVTVGFPLALLLSWVFDLTPAGVVRTEDTEPAAKPPANRAPSPPTARQEPLENSVAVLPLDNLSPNPDDAYFAAGIHEEILTQLAKIHALNVIARTSVMQYAGAARPISDIADELRVGAIMEGSVRYAGNRVRVTAQLIEAATGTHLWTETYDRDLEDIFAIQSDIAKSIAKALEAELVPEERRRIEKQPTNSPEAYSHYLRAMTTLQEHGLGVGGSRESRTAILTLLDKAISIDPGFAAAYAVRARVNIYSLNFDPGSLTNYAAERRDREQNALHDLETALSLDASLGSAYLALALTHQYNWRLTETNNAFDKALEFGPNDPDVLYNYSHFCAFTDRHEKGIELGKRAVTLDPNGAPRFNFLSLTYAVADRLDDAIAAARRAVDLTPDSGVWQSVLVRHEIMAGDVESATARAHLCESLLKETTNPVLIAELTCVYGLLGLTEDAQRTFKRLEVMGGSRRIPPIAWTAAYIGLGNESEALRWLTECANNPEPYEAYFSVLNAKHNTFRMLLYDKPEFEAQRKRLGHHD
jgi:TolB-like protein/Flp pilus assembly protein TadD